MYSDRCLYETQEEHLCNYGENYVAYGIYLMYDGETVPLYHDVTMKYEEAERICTLLNSHSLEPEQAKYVIEDYVLGCYIV